MREIKFRAWDKKTKQMEKFTLHSLVWNYDQQCFLKDAGADLKFDVLKEDVEIMQYTNLLDKNGKGIYEGDILKTRFHDIGLVKFGSEYNSSGGDDSSKFLGYYIETKNKKILQIMVNDECRDEIIGNVFENPELLTPTP